MKGGETMYGLGYERPEVICMGSVAELTAGTASGSSESYYVAVYDNKGNFLGHTTRVGPGRAK